MDAALQSKEIYQQELTNEGFGKIATENRESEDFFYGEDYHYHCLHRNPTGYCDKGNRRYLLHGPPDRG